MMETMKTWLLLTLLTVLLVMLGGYFGGINGMLIALLLAGGMNFVAYFYSDQMILRHYHAVPVDQHNAAELYGMLEKLSRRSGLPVPAVYIIKDHTPNAFATGRDPEHSAIAVTEGLLNLLEEEEIEAVLAHELSHIANRDILISTIAATIAGAIAMIANVMQFGAVFGSHRTRNPVVMLIWALLLPLTASIIQMSISRSREYKADAGSAYMTGHPEWLQSALVKLEAYNKNEYLQGAMPETSHIFTVSPFTGKDVSFSDLFKTHPKTRRRLERLEALKDVMNGEKSTLYERHRSV